MSFNCVPCRKSFSSAQTLATHIQSTKHKQTAATHPSSPPSAKAPPPNERQVPRSPGDAESEQSLVVKAKQCAQRAAEIGNDLKSIPFLVQASKCYFTAGEVESSIKSISSIRSLLNVVYKAPFERNISSSSSKDAEVFLSWVDFIESILFVLHPKKPDMSPLSEFFDKQVGLVDIIAQSDIMNNYSKAFAKINDDCKLVVLQIQGQSARSSGSPENNTIVQRMSSFADVLIGHVISTPSNYEKLMHRDLHTPCLMRSIALLMSLIHNRIFEDWHQKNIPKVMLYLLIFHDIQNDVLRKGEKVPKFVSDWFRANKQSPLWIEILFYNLSLDISDEKILFEVVYWALKNGDRYRLKLVYEQLCKHDLQDKPSLYKDICTLLRGVVYTEEGEVNAIWTRWTIFQAEKDWWPVLQLIRDEA